MKVVVNKKTSVKLGEELLDRAGLLKVVLNLPPERGITVTEMRSRYKILDKLEGAGETISFEDAEFTTVKKLYNEFGWLGNHRDILDLGDHLDEVEKQKT